MKQQIKQQEIKSNALLTENLDLRTINDQTVKDLDVYKETLKRLYVVYVEQQKLVEVFSIYFVYICI